MAVDFEAILGVNALKTLVEYESIIPSQNWIDSPLEPWEVDSVTGTLYVPGPDFIENIHERLPHRSPQVRAAMRRIYATGNLAGTGHLFFLPKDQDLEHGISTNSENLDYLDPECTVMLGIEGGCNAVAMPMGDLRMVRERFVDAMPIIAKYNINELLTYPHVYRQTAIGSVKDAWNMGAGAIGATCYFSGPDARREMEEIAGVFSEAHALGMVTVLWCYLRNPELIVKDGDKVVLNGEVAADAMAQACHEGVVLGADIVKQKFPEYNSVFNSKELKFSANTHNKKMYEHIGDNPMDWSRWLAMACYRGRVPIVCSGGPSSGEGDLKDAIWQAAVTRRGGESGMIVGRKSFQKPMKEGVELMHAIQEVYTSSLFEAA